jgi:very-short-patch-repair endonuclease
MQRPISPKPAITRARQLRLNATDVEKRLWQRLRSSQLGPRFRRQHPVGPYILDFACETHRLCVELDGGQHNDPAHSEADAKRTAYLESLGWRVLRFWNNQVIESLDDVLAEILRALTQNHEE